MGEPRRHLDLAQEALGADVRRDLGTEHLERNRAVVAKVVGEEHDRHPALAQLARDGVTARESVFKALLYGRHGAKDDPHRGWRPVGAPFRPTSAQRQRSLAPAATPRS